LGAAAWSEENVPANKTATRARKVLFEMVFIWV